ncbi:hypothetical protein MNBD_ALPHA08-686 [hydrothermal vent metagenome]|uniref:Uncharacterized protein n=1 Tax=hydrothermal vent metagenome TaxID=652676 RepID=A0A3B0RXH9_9ZZZZ
MKKFALTTIAAAATVAMLSAPSFADTIADDEPVFTQTVINHAVKTDQVTAGFKAQRKQTDIQAFDQRFKDRDQGAADKR